MTITIECPNCGVACYTNRIDITRCSDCGMRIGVDNSDVDEKLYSELKEYDGKIKLKKLKLEKIKKL